LSDVLKMIEKGAILDGKTLTSVLLYARLKSAASARNRTDKILGNTLRVSL
jgi:hypothetical protein